MRIKFFSRFVLVVLFVGFVVVHPQKFAAAASDFDGKSWWDHVKFFADDKLDVAADTGQPRRARGPEVCGRATEESGRGAGGRARFLSAGEICFAADC